MKRIMKKRYERPSVAVIELYGGESILLGLSDGYKVDTEGETDIQFSNKRESALPWDDSEE